MSLKKETFYHSIYSWLEDQIKSCEHSPIFIGLSAPHGAGKTTLTSNILNHFQNLGYKCVGISIDDFYLTHNEQKELAQKFPNNPYLQKRGYPGTHDIGLGIQVLSRLKEGLPVEIPRYNKAAYNGLGDRAQKSDWTYIEGSIDLVLLEGWMLGFKATAKNQMFEIIDENLKAYEAWVQFIDSFIYLQAKDYQYLVDWRIEAEKTMAREGNGALEGQELEDYVKTFLPAYEVYQNTILERNWKNLLHFVLDKNRLPI